MLVVSVRLHYFCHVMFCNFCFWFFLYEVGDCGSHNDTPIRSRCPSGKDHGVEGGHQLKSPIETSPISVAPPSGM